MFSILRYVEFSRIHLTHDCASGSSNHGETRYDFVAQAAHALLQYQETNKPVYKTKNISLSSLCEHYSVPVNPMKDQLKYLCHRDYKFWSRRPLSRDMILYAAADVVALVPHIYDSMRK